MKVSKAVEFLLEYHRSSSRRNTIRAYEAILAKFCERFGGKELDELSSNEVLSFLNEITEGRKSATKRTRYSHLSAFFNFIKNNHEHTLHNPCDTPMMRKLFRAKTLACWNIIERETVDEVIFKTSKY